MLQFSIITISTFVTLLNSVVILVSQCCFKKDIKKIIPIFSLIFGLVLGIGGYYTPNVEMGSNLIEAIFIGLSAGAAATGVNQVGKQLTKDDSMNSIILYLKKFVDSIEVPEDTDNEIPCDGTDIIDINNDTNESTEISDSTDVPADDIPEDYNENE